MSVVFCEAGDINDGVDPQHEVDQVIIDIDDCEEINDFAELDHLEGVPKIYYIKTKSKPKLSVVGLNFTMNITLEGLIRLSISKKQPKN